jgi:hypothetical protein
MGGFVEHGAVVGGVEQVGENAGVDAHMHYEKGDEEDAGKSHDQLFADRRSKGLFPGHHWVNFLEISGFLSQRKCNTDTAITLFDFRYKPLMNKKFFISVENIFKKNRLV